MVTAGSKSRRIYLILVSWILVLWPPDTIASSFGATGEMIVDGILDVSAKGRFAVSTFFLHRKIGQVEKHSRPDIHVQRIQPKRKQKILEQKLFSSLLRLLSLAFDDTE